MKTSIRCRTALLGLTSLLIACGAHAVTLRPEFAAGLAIDPLTLAAMAQFDQDVEASLSPV